jgi:hypothetical protein
MKKLIFLILMLVVLVGCKSGEVKNTDNLVVRSGVITKLEMSTWMYGTHVLSDEGGKPLTALEGNTDLNFDKYQGEKVEVTGTLKEGYPLNGGPELLEVKTIKKLD